MRMRRTLSVALCALLLVPALLTGCTATNEAAGPLTVTVAAAQEKALDTTLSVTGVLVPAQTVSVSSKASGTVAEVKAEVGDTVKAGDVLLTMDKAALKTQLSQAKATLKAAKAQVKSAKSQATALDNAVRAARGAASVAKINRDALQKSYDEMKDMVKDGLATDAQLKELKTKLDVAKAQYNTAAGATVRQASSSASAADNSVKAAEANVDVAEANVKLMELQVGNAEITAPIDGVVVTRTVNAGETATATVALLTIADTGTLKLKGTVPQEALPLLLEGQTMDVAIDIYPGQTFTGTISLLGPMAVSTGEYFPIEVSLTNDGTLRAGLSAHANLTAQTASTLTVPDTALVKGDGQTSVYVVKDGVATLRAVTTGLSNGTDTQILNGLDAGEQVAVTNVNNLSDGLTVAVSGT